MRGSNRGLATNIICSFGGPQRDPSVDVTSVRAARERDGLLNVDQRLGDLRFC